MPLASFVNIDSKIKLKPSQSFDPWFYTNCSINPYRGCQFDCSYCDGKANYYNIPNFSTLIRSKNDFPRLLAKELIRLGFEPRSGKKQTSLQKFYPFIQSSSNKKPKKFILAVGGGVTDSYQPLEKEKGVMRKILKILIDFEIPSFFITKSILIERDLDLIGELHDVSHAKVNFSCAFIDGKDKNLHEPSSPSIARRFETLEKFSKAGIPCGTLAMPILPFIADDDNTLEYLVKSALESKAQYILTAGLTLKPGNRELFLQTIEHYYPQYLEQYKQMFPENNSFGIPKVTSESINVTAKAHVLAKKYDIFPRVTRYVPEGWNAFNLLLSEKLWYIHYLRKWVLNELSFNLDKEFTYVTTVIDNYPLSLNTIDLDEVQQFFTMFNFSKYFQDIILDILQNGESKQIEKIESLLKKRLLT